MHKTKIQKEKKMILMKKMSKEKNCLLKALQKKEKIHWLN